MAFGPYWGLLGRFGSLSLDSNGLYDLSALIGRLMSGFLAAAGVLRGHREVAQGVAEIQHGLVDGHLQLATWQDLISWASRAYGSWLLKSKCGASPEVLGTVSSDICIYTYIYASVAMVY